MALQVLFCTEVKSYAPLFEVLANLQAVLPMVQMAWNLLMNFQDYHWWIELNQVKISDANLIMFNPKYSPFYRFRTIVTPSLKGNRQRSMRSSRCSLAFRAWMALTSSSSEFSSTTLPDHRVLSKRMSPPGRSSWRHSS